MNPLRNNSNDVQDKLLAKCGKAVIALAADFLSIEVGEKLPTVSDFEMCYGFSRGTIQNAFTILKQMQAIETEARGSSGTFLVNKKFETLLNILGIDSVVGCMPLPYSKRYEGLATGLTMAIEHQYGISSSLVFVRGAKNRIAMLLSDRCDYAIISLLAAKEIMKNVEDLLIVKDFGPNSYTSDHVIVFHDPKATEIQDGMRVGVDGSSVDHQKLAEDVCRGKKVNFVNLSYSNVLRTVSIGEIDCTVWNKDEIFDKYMNINYINIDKNRDDTVAVMVVNRKRLGITPFLEKAVDVTLVRDNQKLVIDGMIVPTY